MNTIKYVVKNFLLFISVMLLAGCGISKAFNVEDKFKEIKSFQEIQDKFEKVDSKTIVVFDVDGTLTYGVSPHFFLYDEKILKQEDDGKFVVEAKEKIKKYLEKKKKEVGHFYEFDLFNSTLSKSKDVFVDPTIAGIIKKLQARGVKVIGLTSLPAGDFGAVKCARELRYKKLKKLGIDFSSAFEKQDIVFDKLNKYNGDYPMFYKGILFTNWNNDKGTVLGSFFKVVGLAPTKVLFFDDHKNHLKEVEKEMHKLEIAYDGYWFRGFMELQKPEFNRAIAELQLKHVLAHDELLSVDEAEEVLRKSNAAKSKWSDFGSNITPAIA